MSEELLINVSPMESRVAILSNGVLSEVYIERHNKLGLVGNIYIGTVVRVLPGMQAAFIDIGQSRTAFLHVNDMQKPRKENPSASDNNTQPQQIGDQTNISDLSGIRPASDKIAFATAANLNQQNNNILPRFSQLANPQAIFAKNTPPNHGLIPEVTVEPSSIATVTDVNTDQDSISLAPLTDTQNADSAIASPSNHELNNHDRQSTTQPISTGLFSSNQPSNESLASNATTNQTLDSVSANHTTLPLQTNSQNDTTSHSSIKTNAVSVPPSALETTSTQISPAPEQQNHTHDIEQQMSPSFRVLPTVTEVLSKESLTPSKSQDQKDINQLHDSFGMPPTDSFTTSASKRQSKSINPEELIQNRLREGQRILVQVTKDQLGTKGARLTTNISLPSRYLVYLPSSDNIGISQRIDNTEERHRLKNELSMLMQTVNLRGGLIARTAAERIPTQKLEEDIYYLLQLWRTIQARQQEIHPHQSSVMVYQELSLPLRSIRDLVHEDTERVVVDDANMYDYLRQFAHEFVPMIYPRIVPYHSQQPMFDVHRVEEDLRDALKRRVDLKSGGYLIIDQTEAMTTIDVNTGSYVGGRSLEDTVYKTNLEATHAIARQLRLRNLGGIIILDFIDMQEQEHRDDVLISLQTQLAEDYARTNITQVSELGLVEMTRKRTRESLEQQLCEPCSTCQGRGFIKTAETVCFEIFREIMRCARTYNAPKQFTVVAHAAVIDLLLTSEADTVADLEYLLGRVITFEVENLYTQEQYDIVLD